MDLSRMNILFSERDLSSQLRAKQQKINNAVDEIPKEQFLIASNQELAEHIEANFRVEPLVLQENIKTMNQVETKVDVSGDGMRSLFHDDDGPLYVPGTRIDVNIPFTGEKWLFRYKTNHWSSVFPHGKVNQGSLRISISLPHDVEQVEFKTRYDREFQLVMRYVEWSKNQVDEYNESLPQLVQQVIANRRERLSKHANIASLLKIPLALKADAPSITPVTVEVRQFPPLPVPPKTGLKPEPGIGGEVYEKILHFIRHQGRTFERTPNTYTKLREENLRNIILAQLNGYFEGNAVGEVFRKLGKTDIAIEQENRAAFIGECKVWAGPASLIGALDQLLGYLTWRDSKAALIFFNLKNKRFSEILDRLPQTIREHRLYIRDLAYDESGEWRVQMRSNEDEGRRVTVHVFIFNLYHGSKTNELEQ